jgi:hypothetical protein
LQPANKSQNSKRDEVLKQMLRTKPQPKSKQPGDAQLGFSEEKKSSDISNRNKKVED